MEPPAAGRSPDDGGPPPKRRALLAPHRRPAFDPGLLASPFYRGPTRYGGAGDADRTRFERRLDVRPRSAPPNAPPLSETSKRIGALLAQFSSPLADARRAPPARAVTPVAVAVAPTSPRRLRELRVPSMAALLKLKRNNRTVGSAQAAIAASLSSSSPYDYSPRSDALATKPGSKRRAPDEPPQIDAPPSPRLEKRFRFRDPVDAFAPKLETKRANPVSLWNGASHAHDDEPKAAEPANDRFAAILAEQKSKWECGACLLKNESARNACASCETPRPGAEDGDKQKRRSDANSAPAPASGFSALLQKQKTQWECAACMLMNDSNRSKCACCETAKPGSEPSKPAVAFSFDATPKLAFKFGIDESQNDAEPKPRFDAPEPSFVAPKPSTEPPKFSFGIPPAPVSEPKPDTNGIGSVSNGAAVARASELDTERATVGPTTKLFEPDVKQPEPAKLSSPPLAILSKDLNFTFSPSKFDAKSITNDKHASISKLIPLPSSPDTNSEPPSAAPVTCKTPPSTSSASVPVAVTQSLFSFGASPSTQRAPFGGSPTFNFDSTRPAVTSSPAPFKSSELFTFGTKTTAPRVSDANPSFATAPKVCFNDDKPNVAPFCTLAASVTPQKVTVPNEPVVSDVAQFRSPVSEKSDAPLTSKPIFCFTSPVTCSIVSSTCSSITNSSTTSPAVFAFGATATTNADQSATVPMFGAQVASPTVFGTQPADSNKTSSSSSIFKMNPTTTTAFSSMPGSIFGSKAASTANLFGTPNQSVENKPCLPVFGSQITNVSSPSSVPTGSIFSNQSTSVASFNSGNIFGSSGQLTNNNNNVQSTNLFSTPTPNKQSNVPETGSGMFGTKSPQAGPFFNANLPTGTTLSTGGIFGSHPGVPTPVFGASIPFGEATQTQPAQNTPFKFGAPNPSQSTVMPFGQAPAAGSSAPVFSFGSSSVAPAPSQFNFSIGAPSGFSNTGANAGVPARRFKKAVRRNPSRM